MGSKGDVDISGTGGDEPRDDYAPMSSVLSTDFPVFEDGAGEVEEIPGGLPFDGTLYYFQSSYVFNTFPGTDGYFGFSNDTTYPHSGRKNTYGEVVAPGDWFADYATNRIYSFLDNLADSYVHMCEQDITYVGGGLYSYHWGSTITFHELDGTGLGVGADGVRSDALKSIYEAAFLGNGNTILLSCWLKFGAGSSPYLLRSFDRGATWAVANTFDVRQDMVAGPKGDPDTIFVKRVNAFGASGWYYTTDLVNFVKTVVQEIAGSSWSYAPIAEEIPGAKIFAQLRSTGSAPNYTYHIDEWNTGGPSNVKSWLPSELGHGGNVIHNIDTLAFEVEGVGWFDSYVMCSRVGGSGPSGSNWVNTTWKSRLYYWIPASFDDGVGWSADNDPDFHDFEDIVFFSEIERAGVVMIARFNANGAYQYDLYGDYNHGYPPDPGDPREYYFKLYVSQDLGQSYTHVATLTQYPDGSLIDTLYTGYSPPNNSPTKMNNVLKVGSGQYVCYGLQKFQFTAPLSADPMFYFSIDGGWIFLEHQVDKDIWGSSNLDFLYWNSAWKTDTTGQQHENPSHPGVYYMDEPVNNGIHWNGTDLLTIGPASGGGSDYIRIITSDRPDFEYYTVDQIVCDSAGFVIRAQHVNELRRKLLHLNANVQTGGTKRVNFGIDVSDLPTVQENKTAVRADHYAVLKREHDSVAGQVGAAPGVPFYTTGESLVDIMSLAETPVADGVTDVSIRTLLAMRKVIQALFTDGWFCACYSYCPCQTFVDISIEGGKK